MKRNDTYVSAAEPELVRPETPVGAAQIRLAPQTTETVLAVWRNNAGMGIGVFSVLMSGFFIVQIIGGRVGTWHNIWTDLDGTLTWLAFSALAGAQAFGWLMIWRSNLDERRMQGELNEAADAVKDRDEYIDKLEERIANQEQTIANLRQDLAERMMLQQRAEMKAAQRATYTPSVEAATEPVDSAVYRDARLLVERACRNQPYSKYAICGDGKKPGLLKDWTQDRWRAAHKLAQEAGLFRVVGNQTELLVDDLSTALAVMDVYAGWSE